MFHRKKRGRKRADSSRRKDRLIQTRVGARLERAIKTEAENRRVTVSHLLRNVLEECFHLVDDVVDDVDTIVSDSLELARKVRSDATRSIHSNRYNIYDKQPIDDDAEEREYNVGSKSRPQRGITKAFIESVPDRGEIESDPLGHIYAWNRVVLSQSAFCSLCSSPIQRGEDAYVGLSDDPRGDRSWLCATCIDKI